MFSVPLRIALLFNLSFTGTFSDLIYSFHIEEPDKRKFATSSALKDVKILKVPNLSVLGCKVERVFKVGTMHIVRSQGLLAAYGVFSEVQEKAEAVEGVKLGKNSLVSELMNL